MVLGSYMVVQLGVHLAVAWTLIDTQLPDGEAMAGIFFLMSWPIAALTSAVLGGALLWWRKPRTLEEHLGTGFWFAVVCAGASVFAMAMMVAFAMF